MSTEVYVLDIEFSIKGDTIVVFKDKLTSSSSAFEIKVVSLNSFANQKFENMGLSTLYVGAFFKCLNSC